MKEPEIKLFGTKILLPENVEYSGEVSNDCTKRSIGVCCDHTSGVNRWQEVEEAKEKADYEEEDRALGEDCEAKPEDEDRGPDAKNRSQNSETMTESDASPKNRSSDEDVVSEDRPKSENEGSNGQQKTLKKPDKILPCPRCNSMDTKFCYYNNYNVNQPRHFCKSCQRYWTAGGTMRNVPVGAGRRKNKNSISHCRHISISEALQAARIDAANGFHHSTFKPKGTILSFGPDSQLSEAIVSCLNLADKRVLNDVGNGYYKIDQRLKNHENIRDDCSVVRTSNPMRDGCENGVQVQQNVNGFASPVPCIPGVPWPFPWNPAVPLPATCPQGYPMPFYPAPYWNYGVPNAWNVPLLSVQSPTVSQKETGTSSSNSPLGKHSRKGELLKPNNSERKEDFNPSSIVVPKTLRIDDPEEAAKSSIWSTLGIKYDFTNREGLFKALQPKDDQKKARVTTSPALQANPAALSRSLKFQERA